jgi:hypothetical protein
VHASSPLRYERYGQLAPCGAPPRLGADCLSAVRLGFLQQTENLTKTSLDVDCSHLLMSWPLLRVLAAPIPRLSVPNETLSRRAAVGGKWVQPKASKAIPCPMTGEDFMKIPNTQPEEAQPFINALKAVPKSGMHNPFKNPERCALSLREPAHTAVVCCSSCCVQCQRV